MIGEISSLCFIMSIYKDRRGKESGLLPTIPPAMEGGKKTSLKRLAIFPSSGISRNKRKVPKTMGVPIPSHTPPTPIPPFHSNLPPIKAGKRQAEPGHLSPHLTTHGSYAPSFASAVVVVVMCIRDTQNRTKKTHRNTPYVGNQTSNVVLSSSFRPKKKIEHRPRFDRLLRHHAQENMIVCQQQRKMSK